MAIENPKTESPASICHADLRNLQGSKAAEWKTLEDSRKFIDKLDSDLGLIPGQHAKIPSERLKLHSFNEILQVISRFEALTLKGSSDTVEKCKQVLAYLGAARLRSTLTGYYIAKIDFPARIKMGGAAFHELRSAMALDSRSAYARRSYCGTIVGFVNDSHRTRIANHLKIDLPTEVKTCLQYLSEMDDDPQNKKLAEDLKKAKEKLEAEQLTKVLGKSRL